MTEENAIAKVDGGALANRPDFLANVPAEDRGTEILKKYVSPPFMKIVQGNSKEPYNQYPEGSVLAVPLNVELFAPGQEFHITPVFMYPEYVLTNPFPLKHLPFIREREFDPQGVLAARCRDFKNRNIICPEAPLEKQSDTKFMCTYFEHLNFLCLIWEHESFRSSPIVMTFRSGEFKTGKKLAGMIDMRGDVPMYGCRFAAYTAIHNVSGNENYGLNFDNPAAEGMSPWVSEQEFKHTSDLFERFRELHGDGALRTEYEDDSAEKDATVDAPEM